MYSSDIFVVPVDNVERPSPSIDYSLEYTSSGVCVKCTFLDTDTSECIAIVHSESDLMNIESSHKFNRSGDTASGCIEGVNLEDYLVGVVGGKLLKSGMLMLGIVIIFPIMYTN